MIADRQNIIVVQVAYRLGVFGFAHNSEFIAEDGVMGNFGTLDQRMAMQWVKKHISNLGGDPDKVTISGKLFLYIRFSNILVQVASN